MNRRDFHRLGAIALGNLAALALTVPGVAYLLDPILKKAKGGTSAGAGAVEVGRLSQLAEGVPQAFAVVEARDDAWVKYPREPVGSVWLIKRPGKDGGKPRVEAFSAECPHLGCAVNLAGDGKSFLCPCHTSNFDFDGKPLNDVPPRPMDALTVELSDDADPAVRVAYRRFRTMSQEKIPLV